MRPASARTPMLALLALLMVAGCRSYLYTREVSPEILEARQEYTAVHPSSPYGDDVLDGRVRIGMTREVVRTSWGAPDEVRTGKRPGVDEIWSYKDDDPARGTSLFRLHFVGDRLDDIEVRRSVWPLPAAITDSQRPPSGLPGVDPHAPGVRNPGKQP